MELSIRGHMIICIHIRAIEIEEIHGSSCDVRRHETSAPLGGQQQKRC